ncbi:MAG: iron-containing alcohol dehydrogenase [Clostridia bacterium]|nr:iron-containing alcohol dehydrogenase [Clostridia bacterium]
MTWEFSLPVKIYFGTDKIKELPKIIEELGYKRGVLVCSNTLKKNGVAEEIIENSNGKLVATFSDIRPNPTTDNVNACVKALRENNADFAVALGGGSPMDCCKAACAIAKGDDIIESYHTGGKPINKDEVIPMIAVATTSGTGSEITNISVLTDLLKNVKSTMNDPLMYPKAAIVDPRLTLSVPPKVTASTGLDVLAHALESVWSVLHQPICESCSVHATKLVFEWLYKAYSEPQNLEAREKMAEASIVAGVAFSNPRTAGSHACSFPLTNLYGVPHGEACAMTLDFFTRFNAEAENGRLNKFARDCGFSDAYALADAISDLKKKMGMAMTLTEIGVETSEEIETLTKMSMTPLMERNIIPLSYDDIKNMYISMK